MNNHADWNYFLRKHTPLIFVLFATLKNVTFFSVEKSSLNIVLNISFCVPQKKVSRIGLEQYVDE